MISDLSVVSNLPVIFFVGNFCRVFYQTFPWTISLNPNPKLKPTIVYHGCVASFDIFKPTIKWSDYKFMAFQSQCVFSQGNLKKCEENSPQFIENCPRLSQIVLQFSNKKNTYTTNRENTHDLKYQWSSISMICLVNLAKFQRAHFAKWLFLCLLFDWN